MTDWFDEVKKEFMFQSYEINIDEKYLEIPRFIPSDNYIGERKVNAKKLEKRRKKNKARTKAMSKVRHSKK